MDENPVILPFDENLNPTGYEIPIKLEQRLAKLKGRRPEDANGYDILLLRRQLVLFRHMMEQLRLGGLPKEMLDHLNVIGDVVADVLPNGFWNIADRNPVLEANGAAMPQWPKGMGLHFYDYRDPGKKV